MIINIFTDYTLYFLINTYEKYNISYSLYMYIFYILVYIVWKTTVKSVNV